MKKFKVAFWKRLWMAMSGKELFAYWSMENKKVITTFTKNEKMRLIATMTGGLSLPAKPIKVQYENT
jgi:hypothetical protein